MVANDKPFQEAFDITLNGDIGADKANAKPLKYLWNGAKKGMWCEYRYGGWSAKKVESAFTLSPFDPILVYRKFTVNPDNYIYLRDDGRIMANLSIYDELRTGLSFYSTPDSTARQDLTLSLTQINIGEFKRVIPYMPDIEGVINSEAHYVQTEDRMDQISLENSINQLSYNGIALGDWALSAVYLPKQTGEQHINGLIMQNDNEVISIEGSYFPR